MRTCPSSASTLLSIEIFHLVIPLTVLSLGYSAIQAGWCTFAFLAPGILVKIFIAPTIEKSDKKKILLQNEIIRVSIILIFILILSLIKDINMILFIIPVSFLFGIFTTITEITEPSALKILLRDQNATSIISKYEIRTRAVQLLAPTLCGALLSLGLFYPYILMTLLSFISIFLLLNLNLFHDSNSHTESRNLFQSIKEAIIWIKNKPMFYKVVVLTSINNFLHPILYLTIIYQLTFTDMGFDITGYILSGLGIGGIIGSIISSKLLKLINFNQLVIGVNIFRIIVFAGFILFPYPWGYFIFFVFKAILGGVWNVCYNIYTINEMPHYHIARVSALSSLIIKSSAAIGSLFSGYLIKYSGVNFTLYILVILTIMMLLYTINIEKYNRKQ